MPGYNPLNTQHYNNYSELKVLVHVFKVFDSRMSTFSITDISPDKVNCQQQTTTGTSGSSVYLTPVTAELALL